MVKDEEIFPIDTVVRIKSTGEFALIKKVSYLRDETKYQFLNYLAVIEGRGEGTYALYHDDIELEAWPLSM